MTKSDATEKKAAKDDNVIFVGKKPTMSYVMAVMTQFSDGKNEVHIKARGNSISRAVDVAEIVRRKFLHDTKNTVEIGTDEVEGERGKLSVSTINVILRK